MKLLAVAYPELGGEDFDLIEEYRRKYDPQKEIIKPHFTLVFPLEGVPVPEFIAEIKKQLLEIHSFSFAIRTAKVHKDALSENYYTFLVPDEANDEICHLNGILYSGILSEFKRAGIPFIPHITIGAAPAESLCKEAANSWNTMDRVIEGRIAAVDILGFDGSVVTPVERLNLL